MVTAFFDSFDFMGWGLLVHIAALTQVVGYLIRHQLWLRTLLFVGTLFYMAYYWLYPDVPLWDAIFWSAMLALANLISMVMIVRDRTLFRMSLDEERLYRVFSQIIPGDFRRLMKVSSFHEAGEDILLTEEGTVPDHLFYVIDGQIKLTKGQKTFDYNAGTFIGELSMVTEKAAVATVSVTRGARYVAWERGELARLLARHTSMKLALDVLVTRDMATKVQAA